MTEKTLMIVSANVNPNEIESYEQYTQNAGPIFKKAGGVPVAKYQIKERIIGTGEAQFVVVMEFPSVEVIKNLFESEEYKALLPIRDKAYTSLNVFLGEG
jgi:uncharacterized protein (DUF1330 family)